MNYRGLAACQKWIWPDNSTMSAQEIFDEEFKHSPNRWRAKSCVLEFLERQRDRKRDGQCVADTWEKIGASAEADL